MTTSIVTAPMARKAATLAELLPTFSRGTSKLTGQRFIVVPASNCLSAHWTAVDGSGCTCLGHQRRGTCTHSIAAKLVHDRQQPAVPKARKSYAALFPKCHGCDDLADTRDGFCDRCASDRERQARRDARSH
jgi:hypothetical protein